MSRGETSDEALKREVAALRDRVRELERAAEQADDREPLGQRDSDFRDFLDQLDDVAYRTDAHGNVTYANRYGELLTGTVLEELLNKPFLPLFTPESQPIALEAYQRTLNGESPERELTFITGRTCHFRSRPLRDRRGRIVGIFGIARDITERKRAEEALARSAEKYRTLVEELPVGVYRTTPDGRIDDANPALVKMLGFSCFEELAKRNLEADDYQPGHPRHEFRARLEREGTLTLEETKWKKRDGSLIYVRENARAVRDATGNIVHYEGTVEDISVRRQAVEALRESEERFRTVVDASKDAMVAIDRDGLITLFNPAAEEMFQRSGEEVLGRKLDCLIPRDLRASHEEYVKDYFAAGRSRGAIGRTLELPAVRKDGKAFTVELSLSVGRRAGEPFVLAVIRDITERKRAEEALRGERDFSSGIIAGTPAIVCGVAPEGRTTFVNPAGERITGYAANELIGKNWWHTLYPGSEYGQVDQLLRDFEQGNVRDYEMTLTTRSGEKRAISWNSINRLDESGRLLEIIGFGTDITERKRAEEDLRQSEEKWRLLYSNLPGGSFTVDNEYVIQDVNDVLCAITGYSREELVGQLCSVICPKGPHKCPVFDLGRQWIDNDETAVKTKDGRLVPIIKSARRIPLGDHDIIVENFQDISERKRIEAEKTRLEQQLHEAQRMQTVGQVATGIAHDFGNLLSVVRVGVKSLRETPPPTDRARLALDAIDQATEEAAGAIQSLLMFSRRLPAERVPVKVCELVEDSGLILRHLLPANIELRMDTRRDGPCWVNADASQLRQILMNLTVNARDAMPYGGKLTISVTLHPSGRPDPGEAGPAPFVKIAIKDTGVGIPPDIRDRIFEPSFTTKPPGRGAGLGLTTVRSIVRDHGGRVEVESESGEGTTFTVILPGLAPESMAGPDAPPPPRGRGESILLAEGNRHIRRLIISTLRSWQYQVRTVEQVEGVCDVYFASPERIALLILDVDPPQRDGRDCLRRIRSAGYRTPAILTATATAPETGDEPDEYSVVLRKPFLMSTLGEVLSKLIPSDTSTGGGL